MNAAAASRPIVRVALVETQTLFADALRHALLDDPEVRVLSSTKSLEEIPTVGMPSVDLVLLDIDTYCSDVNRAFTVCGQRFPAAKVCALSSFSRQDVMQRCLAARADGYIVKDTSLTELRYAIKTIAGGTPYVDPRVAGNMLRRRALSYEFVSDDLSGRETEIIRLITEGLSNRDIGTRLALSEKTVKNHVSHIFDKLHITARTQAVVYALRTGIA
jgi:DNA-binding NarL/FixJ family response regulator